MPEGRLLIGIDLGSSGVKAVLLDAEVGILASATHDVALFSDHEGWAEADPNEWWRAVCSLVPRLLSAAPAVKGDVAAVAVSGMVPAVLVLGRDGEPLRRAILQNDARATKEIDEVRTALGELDLLSLSGSVLSQQSVAPTALWLARHEPDVWARTASIVGSYDWMASALGAAPHVEYNWAIESGLYDFRGATIDAVRAATPVNWPTLLEVAHPGQVVGALSAAAGHATGLSAGTTIVVGGADHVFSAYGAGLVEPGDCLIKLGGSGDILAVSDEPLLDARLYLDRYPIPDKWMPNGCMATSGSMLRWEQGLLGNVSLAELDMEANASAPGALITLPFFLGEKTPLHDPDLRGAVLGLHLGTTRGDLHRSMLEAIAFGVRWHFDVFAEDGLALQHPRVTNGGSKSRLWRQIMADVLDRDLVSLLDHPGASFGAAVVAGIGAGVIDDWSYVLGALGEDDTITPSSEHAHIYDERYRQFRQLYESTTSLSHELARSSP